MNGKYILLRSCEKDLDIPTLHDSLEDARETMTAALIDALGGLDESVFGDYKKDDDYGWEPDGNTAWFNHHNGNANWRIIKFHQMMLRTEQLKMLKRKNEESCCSIPA